MRDLSFSQRMQAGASPEELKKYYCMSEDQFTRTLKCLEDLRGKK
jgi:uncharacterized Fe-S cluster-containing radical SAM superfamily protein